MNYSIITANVRDDNDYLDEWITYHLAIGFEKIIIYDHRSAIPVVNTWGDKIVVIRLDRDSLFKPEFIHNDTLKNFKSYWMAHIDVDEFIVLFHHKDINEFLKMYEQWGAVGFCWSMYGGNGHRTKPPGLVKDNYLWHTPDENPMWVKSIINTQYCVRIDDPHFGTYTRPAVTDMFQEFSGPTAESTRLNARINHYFTRSLEEYERKRARGTGNDNTPTRPLQWFYDMETYGTVFDPILMNFKI
jgi:hypothetical protein